MLSSKTLHCLRLLMILILSAAAVRAESCKPDKLAVYKVVLETFWSQDKFPKQYPEFRPHAQWSKVVGRSHNDFYALWRLGQKAAEGVKMFAETGKTDIFDSEAQGHGGIYDEFFAPPISAGAGKTVTEFFVDGNHSKVSMIGRIIPSPDWFIGVDSFDLCVQGKWVDAVTMDVDPLDAGTDNGFTFTAPNWATVPQEKITRITSQNPDHAANSFYYPHLKKLPTIATFTFYKLKEFELGQVFNYDKSGVQTLKYVINDAEVQADQKTTPSTISATSQRSSRPSQNINRHEEPGLRPNDSPYTYKSNSRSIANTISNAYGANQDPSGLARKGANNSKATRKSREFFNRFGRVYDWNK